MKPLKEQVSFAKQAVQKQNKTLKELDEQLKNIMENADKLESKCKKLIGGNKNEQP